MLNTKQVLTIQNVLKKFLGLTAPPRPPAVFYYLHFMLTLWETQSSIQKIARAISA